MKRATKNKALGQFFSGEVVASILFSLSECSPGSSVIDPMAGIGDMFIPLANKPYHCSAVEIDPVAFESLIERVPSAICGNAFSKSTLAKLHKRGYDMVITNPPYVRWQNLEEASSLPFYLPIEEIHHNISCFVESTATLSPSERDLIQHRISELSGLTDLAIPSWILCMMLTKRGGTLAIVVPNSWMSREYATPVIDIFKELFDIKYVINDVNSILFKGKALVQTSLIVAKRRQLGERRGNIIRFISAYSTLLNSTNYLERLNGFIDSNEGEDGVCEIKDVPQSGLWIRDESPILSSMKLSSLNRIISLSENEIVNISFYGIECSQGLRTGANRFFYLDKDERGFVSYYGDIIASSGINKILIPTIQSQDSLGNQYGQLDNPNQYLLYIQDSVIPRDKILAKEYKLLPVDVADYIIASESRSVKGKPIPSLSAVRTNTRRRKENVPPRFWYMLPPLTPRHTAIMFLPRLNAERVHVLLNSNRYVIDANFITINLSISASLTPHAALALMNSTWASIQFEENCTVMGGGALKVDSVQMNRFFFPKLSSEQIARLDSLGQEMARASLGDSSIIERIDTVVLQNYSQDSSTLCSFNRLLNNYITRRNAVR